ncbi:hypothetical protein KAW65_04070 [candidate division WOR-3 bacterium]|nr:hypothetical protein [candidate division WOR-3 bacterium]
MTEENIMSAIKSHIGTAYSSWTIGVTDRPDERKQEHGNPKYWHQWDASTEAVARRIEKYFLDKDCKGAGGGRGEANWVYIF